MPSFYTHTGIWTQVIMPAWQALYCLRYCPIPTFYIFCCIFFQCNEKFHNFNVVVLYSLTHWEYDVLRDVCVMLKFSTLAPCLFPLISGRPLFYFSFPCCDKHHDQKRLGEGNFYDILQLTEQHGMKLEQEGKTITWGWELKQRPLALHELLSLLLSQLRTTCSGTAPLPRGWALSHQQFIKKMHHRPNW